MIKMMVTVVVVYSVCWLPFNVLLNVRENISDDVMKSLYFPLHGLAMSHACYNPIIYCYMNARFRDGFFILMQSIPFIGKRCGTSGSESFPHADVGGTDSTVLQRNNTCTTYISMKHTKRTSGCNNYQLPVRSASVMRNITHAHNGTRRISRYPQTIIDEQQM